MYVIAPLVWYYRFQFGKQYQNFGFGNLISVFTCFDRPLPRRYIFLLVQKTVIFFKKLAHCRFVLLPKLCRRVMVHPVISFTTISGKISLCEKSWNYKFISLWNHIITIIFLLFAFWMSCLMITIKFNNIELIISHWL